MGQVGLRSGLVGSAVALVIAFLSLVPVVGNCLVWVFDVLLWVGVGALVARWTPYGVDEREVAFAGAIAGIVTALIGGLTLILLAPVGLALVGGTSGALRLLPPDVRQMYQSLGVAPQVVYSPIGVFLIASLMCSTQFFAAPLITALAAVVFSRVWSTEGIPWEEESGPYMLEW